MEAIQIMGGLTEILSRILSAVLIGAALGLNRELRDKPAGIKTHALVSLGAALVVIVGVVVAFRPDGVDDGSVSRVIQGLITGIGFLGGGVILQRKESGDIQGLTTAASLWLAAGLGIACGAGQWLIAVIGIISALLVLWLGAIVEARIHRHIRHGRRHGDLAD